MSIVKQTNVNYLQKVDFSDYSDVLYKIGEGKLDVTALANSLGKLTGEPWSSTAGELSVLGAKVVVVGENKRSYPTLQHRTHILIIRLSSIHTQRFAGQKLYLTFNM